MWAEVLYKNASTTSVADPEYEGSASFLRIRIRNFSTNADSNLHLIMLKLKISLLN